MPLKSLDRMYRVDVCFNCSLLITCEHLQAGPRKSTKALLIIPNMAFHPLGRQAGSS